MARILATLTVLLLFSFHAEARDQVVAVGSSTVYPFVTVAAEEFGGKPDNRTPIVESLGTGGGFEQFCSGASVDTPDIANASRRIKASEINRCEDNKVGPLTEIMLGYDGIVVANSVHSPHYSLTRTQLFLALAKKVPVDGVLVNNPYRRWNEIDASLPDEEISVYGPPPTSGTRDAFVELVMEAGCNTFSEFEATYPDKDVRKKACHLLREDGAYIDSRENDNLIIQKLDVNRSSLGIFGFSYLEENVGLVQGSDIDGISPTFDNIADSSYAIARPLFIYAKNNHLSLVKDLLPFLQEITSDDAMGEYGYMVSEGLIPLEETNRLTIQEKIDKLQ